jgi:flagellar hook-associated protein 1 FlgK
MADVVSANIANVLTDGYAPRDVALQSQQAGRGVSVLGITRQVDNALLADLRLAESAFAGSETRAKFITAIERAVGTPGKSGGIAERLTALEASLITAASRPEETSRLQTVIRDADALATSLNQASDRIQTLRSEADAEIARTVENLNADLQNIATLNKQIQAAKINGRDSAGLKDQRQRVIDNVAQVVPIRQLLRDNDQVALVSVGGALLLDGRAALLEFDATRTVTTEMGQPSTPLPGIRIEGYPVRTDDTGPLASGKLAALFENRDRVGVGAHAAVDAIARDLIERVSNAGVDPDPLGDGTHLFTDAQTPFNPADEVGLAARIRLNETIDPATDDETYRIRDGLGAPTPGPVGNDVFLKNLSDALTTPTALAAGSAMRSVAGHITEFSSRIANDRLSADQQVTFANTQASELRSLQLENGVDTDAELQRLLLVEQAFAANARMVRTVDELIQTLLRI